MGLIGFLTLIVPLIGMWLYEGRSTRQSQRG
jgi:ABC-type Fe3+-siderophore transport system permease subunit